MSESETISYRPDELRGYLPTGWRLSAETGAGGWDAERRAWIFSVRDGSDLEWPVVVEATRVAELGRFEALRHALERIVRRQVS